jgi:hypothetical protein
MPVGSARETGLGGRCSTNSASGHRYSDLVSANERQCPWRVVEPCRRFTDNAVFAVLQQPLVTGVAAVVLLVLTAAVYPVIHTRRLETAEVLRSS